MSTKLVSSRVCGNCAYNLRFTGELEKSFKCPKSGLKVHATDIGCPLYALSLSSRIMVVTYRVKYVTNPKKRV